jgi:hypothetical protein
MAVTPEEAWSGKSPTASHFRVFGSLYLNHELEQVRRKLEWRCISSVFQPVPITWYDPKGKKVIIKVNSITVREVHMHDLLQELGKQIVRQQFPDEPGSWSRLWLYEDFYTVMTTETVTRYLSKFKTSFHITQFKFYHRMKIYQ